MGVSDPQCVNDDSGMMIYPSQRRSKNDMTELVPMKGMHRMMIMKKIVLKYHDQMIIELKFFFFKSYEFIDEWIKAELLTKHIEIVLGKC